MTTFYSGAYRNALSQGRHDDAMKYMLAREKLTSQYRDQALSGAVIDFEKTGDTRHLVNFVNNFSPTSVELTGLTRRPEKAGGEPVYVATGIDHETGKPFQQVITQQSLYNMLRAAGDPSTHKGMLVEQAKHHYEMAQLKEKTAIENQGRIDLEQNLVPIKTKLEESRGDITRRNQSHASQLAAQRQEQAAALDLAKHKSKERFNFGLDQIRFSQDMGGTKTKSAGAGNQAADIQKMQFLVNSGVAKDMAQASEMVMTGKGKSAEMLVNEWAKTLMSQTDITGNPVRTPKQAITEARQIVQMIKSGKDLDDAEKAQASGAQFDAEPLESEEVGNEAKVQANQFLDQFLQK